MTAPSLLDTTEDNMDHKVKLVEKYHDSIIQVNIDEDEEDLVLKNNIDQFQMHSCSFTCHKKKKTITIRHVFIFHKTSLKLYVFHNWLSTIDVNYMKGFQNSCCNYEKILGQLKSLVDFVSDLS